jgi:hypothetical protein
MHAQVLLHIAVSDVYFRPQHAVEQSGGLSAVVQEGVVDRKGVSLKIARGHLSGKTARIIIQGRPSALISQSSR